MRWCEITVVAALNSLLFAGKMHPELPSDCVLLPDAICEAVRKCWSLDPAKRPTAKELHALFDSHVAATGDAAARFAEVVLAA